MVALLRIGQEFYRLTKPGITWSNTLVAAAAYVFGSPPSIYWPGFWLTAAGLWMVVASACVANNRYDRGIDARMTRTQERAVPAGRVSPRAALLWSAILLAAGVAVLSFTNILALSAALAGWVVYVFAYTPLKHHSATALYVGAVAGAMPPVAGYAAAADQFGLAASVLFVVLFLWQLPHFWAIAVFRFDEYTAAGVPLAVRAQPDDTLRRRARSIFFISLVALLIICALLVMLHLSARR